MLFVFSFNDIYIDAFSCDIAAFRVVELTCYFAVPAVTLPWIFAADCVFRGDDAAHHRRWQQWWDVLLWAVENNGPALIKLVKSTLHISSFPAPFQLLRSVAVARQLG